MTLGILNHDRFGFEILLYPCVSLGGCGLLNRRPAANPMMSFTKGFGACHPIQKTSQGACASLSLWTLLSQIHKGTGSPRVCVCDLVYSSRDILDVVGAPDSV